MAEQAPLEKWKVQWFPQYFPLGPTAFAQSGNVPSGLAGSTARLNKDIPNWPILFLGVRLTNTYALPHEPSLQDIATYELCKEHLDGAQTVEIKLSQQNIMSDPMQQTHLVGRQGIYWAPFGVPFPMAGGNNISLLLTRTLDYPSILDNTPESPVLTPITPVVHATLVCAVAKKDGQTIDPQRVFGNSGP